MIYLYYSKKKSTNQTVALTKSEPKRAAINPSIVTPSKNPNIQKIEALITKVNKPKVKIVIGKEKKRNNRLNDQT